MRDVGQKTHKNTTLCDDYLAHLGLVVSLFIVNRANLILDPRARSLSTVFSIFLDAC